MVMDDVGIGLRCSKHFVLLHKILGNRLRIPCSIVVINDKYMTVSYPFSDGGFAGFFHSGWLPAEP